MAHYLQKNRFKNMRSYLDRLSRIPFNNESVEPYVISPSTAALEADLLRMLNNIVTKHSDCFDGQNGNILDNYIESWKNLAKASLENQRVEHYEKIALLASARKSIKIDAENWLEIEKEELKMIEGKLKTVESDYEHFQANRKPKRKQVK